MKKLLTKVIQLYKLKYKDFLNLLGDSVIKRRELAVASLLARKDTMYLVKFLKMVYIYDLLTYAETGKRAFSWDYVVGAHCPVSVALLDSIIGAGAKREDVSSDFIIVAPPGSKITVRNVHRIKILKKADGEKFKNIVLTEQEMERAGRIYDLFINALPSAVNEIGFFGKSFYKRYLSDGLEGKIFPIEKVLDEIPIRVKKEEASK